MDQSEQLRQDREVFVSAKARELKNRIASADGAGLVNILIETIAAKMHLEDNIQTEISNQEAEALIDCVGLEIQELIDS